MRRVLLQRPTRIPFLSRFTGLLGLALIVAGAYLFSTNRRAIRTKGVLCGLGLQIALALLVLRTGFGRVFEVIGEGVTRLRDFAQKGGEFVFWAPVAGGQGPAGVVFAFHILTIIIFVASLFAILYYLVVMQIIVKGIAIACSGSWAPAAPSP